MEFNLKRMLKALLLSTSEPLAIKDVQGVITRFHEAARLAEEKSERAEDDAVLTNGQRVMRALIDQVPSLVTATQIRDAMESIAADLESAGEPFRLSHGAAGYRLTVIPEYSPWVRLLREEPRPQQLGPATLETLAIVAYRQPVTRAEMEAIRGVAVDGPINRLIDRDLVQVTGRAELPGRPLQYGTTERFLEFAGARSLDELPASDVLSPGRLDSWLDDALRPRRELVDHDMGLADEVPEPSEAATNP